MEIQGEVGETQRCGGLSREHGQFKKRGWLSHGPSEPQTCWDEGWRKACSGLSALRWDPTKILHSVHGEGST